MLVDPATGLIEECDLVFNVGATMPTAAGGGNMTAGLIQFLVGPGVATTPREWTALDHEIGHAFGLDHTNLHPGMVGPALGPFLNFQAPNILTNADFSNPTTPPGPNFGEWPVPIGNAVVPGMVGLITHGGVGADFGRIPIHLDDATGLSLIYPVDMPTKTSSKVPLINATASFRGRVRASGGNTFSAGIFGVNVWAVKQVTDASGTFQTAGRAFAFPRHGAVSGVARNSNGDLLWNDPTAYLTGGIGGAQYFPSPSVVGDQGTGDFSVDGLPVELGSNGLTFGANSGDPIEYDLGIEDAAILSVSAFSNAEWFNDGVFYTGNPLLVGGWQSSYIITSILNLPPLLVSVAPPPIPLGFTVAPDFEVYQVNGLIAPSIGLFLPCTHTPMSVVAGSVIVVDPSATTDWDATLPTPLLTNQYPGAVAFKANPSQISLTSGVTAHAIRELVARPVVSITPRISRQQFQTVTIRARDDIWGVDINSIRLIVNGVDVTTNPLLTLTLTSAVTGTTAANHNANTYSLTNGYVSFAEWTLPVANLMSIVTNLATPIRLSVVVRSGDPAIPIVGGFPAKSDYFDGVGITVTGITYGLGRNDVVF